MVHLARGTRICDPETRLCEVILQVDDDTVVTYNETLGDASASPAEIFKNFVFGGVAPSALTEIEGNRRPTYEPSTLLPFPGYDE